MITILDEQLFSPKEVAAYVSLTAAGLVRVASHHEGASRRIGRNVYLTKKFFEVGLGLPPDKARMLVDMLLEKTAP